MCILGTGFNQKLKNVVVKELREFHKYKQADAYFFNTIKCFQVLL